MKTKFLLLIVLLLQTALALAIKVEGTVLDEMKQKFCFHKFSDLLGDMIYKFLFDTLVSGTGSSCIIQ